MIPKMPPRVGQTGFLYVPPFRIQGISVAGKICLIRYGKTFRGLKVLEAQERGAVGVLLYDDPDDDGYRRGDVYPEGPWRPGSAVQRGSLMFLSQHCGDPLTPGRPALPNAERLARADCRWLQTRRCRCDGRRPLRPATRC